ncbi:MAG: AbrB/MazE/SpoVT family DNA-binding domain-containing protein [Trueperaceae bacterium]
MERFSKTMELGENGRVVIPKEVRKTLGIREGDKVTFIVDNGEVRLTTRAVLVKKLSGSFATKDGHSLTQELLDERREEAERKEW